MRVNHEEPPLPEAEKASSIENVKIRVTALLVLLAVLLGIAAGALAFFREAGSFLRNSSGNLPEMTESLAQNWIDAVKRNDMRGAFRSANAILPGNAVGMPKGIYTDFFESCGLKIGDLISSWTPEDFARWRGLIALSEKKELQSDDAFLALAGKLGEETLFDLARLNGFFPVVLRQLNAENNARVEFFEFRKNGKVWTMFPESRKIAIGSVRTFAPPDAKFIDLYPASPEDYRSGNLLLYRRLAPYLALPVPEPLSGLSILKKEGNAMTGFYPAPVLEYARKKNSPRLNKRPAD